MPFTRSSGFGPLPDLTEQMAGAKALGSIFARESIPLAVIEDRRTQVPLAAMIRIFDHAGRAAMERTFGYAVGAGMRPADYGPWANYSASALTLEDALRRTAATVQFQQRGATMVFAPVRDALVWRYVPPNSFVIGIQHSDHVIAAMTRFVRLFLGETWRPRWVELDYVCDIDAAELEDILGCPILFERPGVGVAISTADLGARRVNDQGRYPTLLDVQAAELLSEHAEPIYSILGLLILRLVDGQSDIDGAARMANLGTQQLQRLLRREGVSYRALLARARLLKARALLSETQLTVTQIALQLGYSDHANFTRAFRQSEGRSPSEYREGMRGVRA